LNTYGGGECSKPAQMVELDHPKNAKKNGVQVINVTQCSGGSVIMGSMKLASSFSKNAS